jgi:hypothetical protein
MIGRIIPFAVNAYVCFGFYNMTSSAYLNISNTLEMYDMSVTYVGTNIGGSTLIGIITTTSSTNICLRIADANYLSFIPSGSLTLLIEHYASS